MGMKGVLQPNHIPVNNYELIVVGLPPITFTYLSGIEEEIDKVNLPDRTMASGGRTKAIDFEARTPAHHTVERLAMEAWFQEGQDPVLPTYKKQATLLYKGLDGAVVMSKTLLNLWVNKNGAPNLEMDNEGNMAEITWGMSCDDALPI